MGSFRLSRRADDNLDSIGVYTLRTWGEDQADRYIGKLEDCCQMLAGNPGVGRSCEEVRPGIRRMEQGKHVVFYREETCGVLICRILHERMLPQ